MPSLKMTSILVIPKHREELSKIAHSKGLSMGALLRVLISDYLRQERRLAAG